MCYLLIIPLSLTQAFSHEVTAKKPECDTILADGQNLLQLAHPKAVSVLQMKLHNLEQVMVGSPWPHRSPLHKQLL